MDVCRRISVDRTRGLEFLSSSLPSRHTQHPSWTRGIDVSLGFPEDLIVISSDLVHFDVNEACLLKMSSNMFNGLIPFNQELEECGRGNKQGAHGAHELYLPESGSVLNTLFFATYNRTSVGASNTSLSDLSLALVALKKYGVSLEAATSEHSFMFSAFEHHCSLSPTIALEVYAIGASHTPDLHALAVYASQFLLSLDLSTIADETVEMLDSIYLRKLIMLHDERIQEFKQYLVSPPQLHEPNPHCDDVGGGALLQAWTQAKAAAEVARKIVGNPFRHQ